MKKILIIALAAVMAAGLAACAPKGEDRQYITEYLQKGNGEEQHFESYINIEFDFPKRHELFLKSDGSALIKEYDYQKLLKSGGEKPKEAITEYKGKYKEEEGKITVELESGKEKVFKVDKKRNALIYKEEGFTKTMIGIEEYVERSLGFGAK